MTIQFDEWLVQDWGLTSSVPTTSFFIDDPCLGAPQQLLVYVEDPTYIADTPRNR